MNARAGVLSFERLVPGQSEAGTGKAIRKIKETHSCFICFRFRFSTCALRFLVTGPVGAWIYLSLTMHFGMRPDLGHNRKLVYVAHEVSHDRKLVYNAMS